MNIIKRANECIFTYFFFKFSFQQNSFNFINADANILKFLYFLFIIFFLFVHLSLDFDKFRKKICYKIIVESLKAITGGIFHSIAVLTARQVKNRYHCAWLVYLSGGYTFVFLLSAEMLS